jgi:hypothetical protein
MVMVKEQVCRAGFHSPRAFACSSRLVDQRLFWFWFSLVLFARVRAEDAEATKSVGAEQSRRPLVFVLLFCSIRRPADVLVHRNTMWFACCVCVCVCLRRSGEEGKLTKEGGDGRMAKVRSTT